MVYGLGSESEELPAFMVMLDGGIKAGAPAYSSGFLPASYQGAVLRTDGSPILNVNRPAEIGADRQRKMLDLVHKYNAQYSEARTHYTELAARMESYELAFKMQTSVPGLADLSRETAATRKLYGLDEAETAEFGTQCLMARRMVERGVRFILAATRAGRWVGTPMASATRITQ